MKKFLSFVLAVVCMLGLVACGNDNSTDGCIDITVSNCNYYLSIHDSLIRTDRVYAAGRWWSSIYRQITINGAVGGIYSDCSIVFEYGKNKTQQTISLNAAGFASFEYTINDSSYTAEIVSCTGKLYL